MTANTGADWATVSEMRAHARARLGRHLWDAAVGGSGRELTLRANERAFDAISLRPRVLTGVGDATTATTIAGMAVAFPVMVGPVGEIQLFHPDGAAGIAAGAAKAGTGAFIGAVSAPGMEVVRAAAPEAPLAFQIYDFGGADWIARLARRAESSGFNAICITVDTPVSGRLERDLRNRLRVPPRARPNFDSDPPGGYRGGTLTWSDLEHLSSATKLPLIVKGILDPRDADLAVKHGARVICVSNHGGRQLEGAPASIDALAPVVAAVAGRAEVLLDGGVRSGVDVARALCLGARGVLVGKLSVLALAAGGSAGLCRLLEMLRDELRTTMVNLGARTVDELGERFLWSSSAP